MLEITDLKYASSNMPVIKVIGVGGISYRISDMWPPTTPCGT